MITELEACVTGVPEETGTVELTMKVELTYEVTGAVETEQTGVVSTTSLPETVLVIITSEQEVMLAMVE